MKNNEVNEKTFSFCMIILMQTSGDDTFFDICWTVPPDIVYGGDTSADLAVSEGDNATLSCRATGRPTPRVSWRREDGEPILIRASSAGT